MEADVEVVGRGDGGYNNGERKRRWGWETRERGSSLSLSLPPHWPTHENKRKIIYTSPNLALIQPYVTLK